MAALGEILASGIASAPLAGEPSSGDLGLVEPFPGGALIALIDPLGHGPEATATAEETARVLRSEPSLPVDALLRRCHKALRRTRGAAISLASVDAARSSLEWLGVGNVDGLLVRGTVDPAHPDDRLANSPGRVGFLLPSLGPRTITLQRGDTLVLATDGIRGELHGEVVGDRTPQEIADAILAHYVRKTDDAGVVVARYLGVDVETQIDLAIGHRSDVAMARLRTLQLAQRLGFPEPEIEALSTAVSEVARNIIVHAGSGELTIRIACERGRLGIVIVASDRGPGILDPALALRGGAGAGTGLPRARRMVDELELTSAPGSGTVVALRKWLQ